MPRKVYLKEILYVRVSKVNREYSREMKKFFKSESNYINQLILNDRATQACKIDRIAKLTQVETLSNPYSDE